MKTKTIRKIFLLFLPPFLTVALNLTFFAHYANGGVSPKIDLESTFKKEAYLKVLSIGDEISKFKTRNPKKKLKWLIARYGKHLIREFIIYNGDSNIVLQVDGEFVLKSGRHQIKYHNAETFLLDIKRIGWDIRTFEKLLITYLKDSIEYCLDQGLDHLENRKFSKAVSAFHSILSYDEKFADAYLGAGLAYNRWGKPSKAIAEWEKAIELDSKLYHAYFAQGVVYYRMYDNDSAIEKLSKAIEIKENHELALFIRGLAHGRQNRVEPSIDDLNKVIALNDFNDAAYYNRGLIKRQIKDIKGAIEDLERADTLRPDKIEYARALSLCEEELLEETKKDSSEIVVSSNSEKDESIIVKETPFLNEERSKIEQESKQEPAQGLKEEVENEPEDETKDEPENEPEEKIVENDKDLKTAKQPLKLNEAKTLSDFDQFLDYVKPEHYLFGVIICVSGLTFFIIVKSLVYISRTKNENIVDGDEEPDTPSEPENSDEQDTEEAIENDPDNEKNNANVPSEEESIPDDPGNKYKEDKILVSDVAVSFGSLDILSNISLSFNSRELIGVLGPSGSGKSTLIHSMCGLHRPSKGQVVIDEIDIYANISKIKSKIGFVPQNDIIHRELSVFRTLMYSSMLRIQNDTFESHRKRVKDVIGMLDIGDRSGTKVKKLSGGQRKRVSIGVELLTSPNVMFLDEPTSGLDPDLETKLMQLLRNLADQGRTIIISTHIMENISLLDALVILYKGNLIFRGEPDEALEYFEASEFKEIYPRMHAHSMDYWQNKFQESAQ